MQALTAERQLLAEWRRRGLIQDDTYHLLEDELDRAEPCRAGGQYLAGWMSLPRSSIESYPCAGSRKTATNLRDAAK